MDKKEKIVGGIALVAIILATIALFRTPTNTITTNEKTIVQQIKDAITGENTKLGGVTSFDEIASGDLALAYKSCLIDPAITTSSTTCLVVNNTGQDWYVDLTSMVPVGKASSTMLAWAATTSSATTTIADYMFPAIGLSMRDAITRGTIGIASYVLGTSTIATGSPDMVTNFDPILARSNSALTRFDGTDYSAPSWNATSTFVLKNGEAVMFGIRAPSRSCGGSVGSIVLNRTCESATSTGRNVVRGFLRYIRLFSY